MDFVIGLRVLNNWKDETYNFILVIIDSLMKMVYYELINVTFNAPKLNKVIFNVVVWYHGLPNLIAINRSLLFILKF